MTLSTERAVSPGGNGSFSWIRVLPAADMAGITEKEKLPGGAAAAFDMRSTGGFGLCPKIILEYSGILC